MNFADDLNMIIVCEACGYTEEEYMERNSVEFNLKMVKFLNSRAKATNKKPAMPRSKK